MIVEKCLTNTWKKLPFVLISVFACFCMHGQEDNVENELETSESPSNPEIVDLPPMVVTGSNIAIDDSLFPPPIITLSHEDIRLLGAQTPIESLRLLPSFVGSTLTEARGNGGMGNASISLRGQGPLSSLTLINGRRAGGNGAINPPRRPGGFSDIMLIPLGAIERIELFKDGASAVYGSDAISGVANIILNNDYEGTRIDALYGNTTDSDAAVKQFSILSGFDFEKTHVTVSADYYDRNGLYRRDRELSSVGSFVGRGASPDRDFNLPFVAGNFFSTGPSFFGNRLNINDFNADIPGQEIKSMFAAIEHEITDSIRVYGDLLVTDSEQDNEIFPTFFQSSDYAPLLGAVNTAIGNGLLTSPAPGETITYYAYDNSDTGGMTQLWGNNSFRYVLGLEGEIGDNIEWDTGFLHTETDITGSFGGILDGDAMVADITAGNFNPFAHVASNIPILEANEVPIDHRYKEKMMLYDIKVSADAIELEAGTVKVLGGFEFRDEAIDFNPGDEQSQFTLLGIGSVNPFYGQRDTFAGFGETVIPVIAPEQDFKGIYAMEIDFAGRYENFSDSGSDPSRTTTTLSTVYNEYDSLDYKIGLRIQPIKEVTIRTSYNTGFRAPTLAESYSRFDGTNRINLVDPLDPNAGGLVTTSFRGNPNLEPEESENIAVGIVLEPSFVPGLTVSVDYYRIERNEAIVNGAQFIVDQAARDAANGLTAANSEFIPLVQRGGVFGATTGALGAVNSQYFNAAKIITQGIEYEVDYKHTFNPGNRIHLTAGANQFLTYKITTASGNDAESFKGRVVDSELNGISPGSIPVWKGFFRSFWYINEWTLGGTLNYIGSYNDDPTFTAGNQERRVESYLSLDLITQYTFYDTSYSWFEDTTVYVGVNNVLDEPPPFSAGSLGGPPFGGYDQSLYTQRNRYWYVGFSKEF